VSEVGGQDIPGSPLGEDADRLLDLFHHMSAQLAESYAALRKSEQRFSLAMQGANDGLWDWDVRTNEVYYSPRWKGMLGYADDEIEPTFSAWERLVHPDDKPAAMQGVEAFLSGELDKFEIEFRMRHKEGHYVDVLSRAFGVRRSPGSPIERIVGTHVDITERKQAAEQARRQSAYLAALHETTLGVVSRLNIAELLETLVDRAAGLVDASFGFVYEVMPGGNEIEVKVGTGWFRRYVGDRLKRGEALSGRVWASSQPLAVDNFEAWSGYTHPEGEVGPAMGVPLRSGTQMVGILGVARPLGASPFQQDEIDLLGRFADLAAIALDNAHLHSTLQEELAERVRTEQALQMRLAFEKTITDISTEFINLAPEEVDHGIERALQTIGEFTGSDRSYVFLFSEDGTMMHNTHEWCRAGVKPLRPLYLAQPTDALPWFVSRIRRLEAAHVPSIANLPPQAAVDRARCLAHEPPTRSVVNVPMVYRGQAMGLLGFDSVWAEKTWDQDSIALLRIVGEVFVNALQHKRAHEAVRSAARAERSRLSRELHDSVTQSLYSVTMYTEAAARLLAREEEATAAEYLRDARDTAQEALREMRLLIFELRPLALEKSGLAGALQARLDTVEKRGGVQAELRVSGVEGMADTGWLPLAAQQELYDIAQEALNNSLKHARAEHVRVCLQLEDQRVHLEVADDGVGFAPGEVREHGGLGLPGMRERVQRLGGQLQIESAPGQGTKVTVEVPRGEAER
jgi:PAS domain S-box-containing protein